MNVGVWGIDWEPGDRAVTTSLEHPGGIGALYNLRARKGVDLVFVDAGLSGPRPRCWTPSTAPSTGGPGRGHLPRALGDGDGLPLGRIAEMAHARGAFLIADGAQAAGAIAVDLAATGADVYAVAAQAWLLDRGHGRRRGGIGGTRSTAARVRRLVHVRVGRLRRDGGQGPDARRYEASNFHRPSIVGMARSIGWLSMFVGLGWSTSAARPRPAMRPTASRRSDGVEVLTPRDRMATLVSFRSAVDAGGGARRAGCPVFAVARTVTLVDALRVSVGFFTSEAELDRFIGCVSLAGHTPETLPPRRTLTILTGD